MGYSPGGRRDPTEHRRAAYSHSSEGQGDKIMKYVDFLYSLFCLYLEIPALDSRNLAGNIPLHLIKR